MKQMPGYLKVGIGFLIFSLIILLLMRYVVPIEIAFGGKAMMVQMILPILVMVILGRKFLRNSDFLLNYGEALKGLFLGTLIASVISMIVTVAIYSGDQAYQDEYNRVQMENTIATMGFGFKMAGKSEDEVALAKENYRAQIESGELETQEFPFKWENISLLLLMGLVNALIFSLISAIFVKQKQSGV